MHSHLLRDRLSGASLLNFRLPDLGGISGRGLRAGVPSGASESV